MPALFWPGDTILTGGVCRPFVPLFRSASGARALSHCCWICVFIYSLARGRRKSSAGGGAGRPTPFTIAFGLATVCFWRGDPSALGSPLAGFVWHSNCRMSIRKSEMYPRRGGSQAERPARTAPLVPGIGSQNGLRGLDKAAGLAACLGREGGAPISPFLPACFACLWVYPNPVGFAGYWGNAPLLPLIFFLFLLPDRSPLESRPLLKTLTGR